MKLCVQKHLIGKNIESCILRLEVHHSECPRGNESCDSVWLRLNVSIEGSIPCNALRAPCQAVEPKVEGTVRDLKIATGFSSTWLDGPLEREPLIGLGGCVMDDNGKELAESDLAT